jgi:metal-dependent amidase/aminoacylase/carboxypeptidase family protein
MSAPSMDKLAEVYIKIRTKKQEVTKELESQIETLDEQLKEIAGAMKEQLVAAGGSSLKTNHGTIYLTKKQRFYPMDWDAFNKWVVENNAVALLEKRIAQKNTEQWLEENPTNPPPGLQCEAELTVTVRKN